MKTALIFKKSSQPRLFTEKAIDEGFDIRGYYLWSLFDNFEWSAGYNYKFGIATTDPATGAVRWKRSAYTYRDLIRDARAAAR